MQQKEFYDLLNRYKSGSCTPEEIAYIEKWLTNLDLAEHEPISAADKELIKQRSKVMLKAYAEREKVKRAPRYIPLYAVAATLILIMVAFVFLFPRQELKISDQPHAQMQTITNTTNNVHELQLDDGSTVYLKPQSTLSYPQTFDDEMRNVTLEGEAFFDISRDTLRPFQVVTNEVVTKVLGTSFTVSAFKGSPQIMVAVKTGKVSVITREGSDVEGEHLKETIVTPNQKVIYNKNNHAVTKTLVEDPQPVISEQQVTRMYFERAPVTEIFKGLEKVYGVTIEVDNEVFESCILTTTIADGSIRARLDIICEAINADYQFVNDKIVISGNGCNNK